MTFSFGKTLVLAYNLTDRLPIFGLVYKQTVSGFFGQYNGYLDSVLGLRICAHRQKFGVKQTKFYWKNIGTIETFGKKKFQMRYHMMGFNHW